MLVTGEGCQCQKLQLTWPICYLQRKKYYNIGLGVNCTKHFILHIWPSKLECLSLGRLAVDKHFRLFDPFVGYEEKSFTTLAIGVN